jgi:Helix-turn-helix domain
MADRTLNSTDKLVADALLLNFRNNETGRCNPSFSTIASAVGKSRRTVINAINNLKAGNDPWLIVGGTRGGSKHNTNKYEFRLKESGAAGCTGEENCTGAENVGRGEAGCTKGVKPAAHELSTELSRTISHGQETHGPDRSLQRPPTGALRDPVPKERTEIVQNRIAKRLGPDGWNILGELPADEVERLTELERADALTDEVLMRAVIAMGNTK